MSGEPLYAKCRAQVKAPVGSELLRVKWTMK